MATKDLSKTIRIELIPAIPNEPDGGRKKRMLITTSKKERTEKQSTAEIELEQQSPYEALLQSIYDAAVITDREGRITDTNARASEFLQYTRRELRRLHVIDLISGAEESLLSEIWSNLEQHRFTLIQAYCERKSGALFPAEIAVNRLSVKGGQQLCFFVRDVTLRRQAEEMLRTEHNAIHNSGSGIAVADLNGVLEYVNPATAALWGEADTDALVAHGLGELFAEPDDASRLLSAVMTQQHTWIGVVSARHRDGRHFAVQVSAARNRNADGDAVGVVLSFVDISDRLRAVDAEREAERHRVMLESLGAVCHHMGQPATVLLANLEMMQRRESGLGADTARLLRSSLEAADALKEILYRLNRVNEYRTTQYLEGVRDVDGNEGAPEARILDIHTGAVRGEGGGATSV